MRASGCVFTYDLQQISYAHFQSYYCIIAQAIICFLNVSLGHGDNEIKTDVMRVGAQEYKMKAGENE